MGFGHVSAIPAPCAAGSDDEASSCPIDGPRANGWSRISARPLASTTPSARNEPQPPTRWSQRSAGRRTSRTPLPEQLLQQHALCAGHLHFPTDGPEDMPDAAARHAAPGRWMLPKPRAAHPSETSRRQIPCRARWQACPPPPELRPAGEDVPPSPRAAASCAATALLQEREAARLGRPLRPRTAARLWRGALRRPFGRARGAHEP